MHPIFKQATTNEELEEILLLQQKNLAISISKKTLQEQGFVTAQHTLPLLQAMNTPYPHIIAKAEGNVIGYALVMLPSFSEHLPVLYPMFEKINATFYEKRPLKTVNYFVMGQICIDKPYRGQGVFQKLYETMRTYYRKDFNYIVTQIAERNPRSLKAHQKVGFKTIDIYEDAKARETWHLVLWDLHQK